MKRTILVVDDNPSNHEILVRILQEVGYQVIEAMNGQEALDIIKSPDVNVNVMLLDLIMPVMDGYQVLEQMNRDGMIHNIPIIVLTGNEEQAAEIRCIKAGASDFLRKPYNAKLVQHKVHNIIRLWDDAKMITKLERDKLTGLYNKEFFYEEARKLLEENPDQNYLMLYFNIVDFKLINAHHGQVVGDKVLKFVGEQVYEGWGKQGVCGRIGSDVFATLIPHRLLISQEEANSLYEENQRKCPVKGISVKCGIFEITDKKLEIATMCDCAKIAEESIKYQYGTYYASYDNKLRQKVMREHQLANYMEEALEQHQFVVYMQPKHSTDTGAVAGAEALVRWVHPELGFISPGEFIPLFEKNGFITKLDYYVWQEVCRQIHEWQENGIETVPVSVNASRADFHLVDLPDRIEGLIDKYDIQPDQLHIEVTESAYTDNPEQIIEAISTLRDMGFRIEMDDFGSGYSSLNMLSELPIDILKLDMRFMECGGEKLKGNKRNILSFIVSLSKWLQLPTVAEGVETKTELEDLKSMGVNYIQGYYYSKPMPMEEFATYMEEHRVKMIEKQQDMLLPAIDTKEIPESDKPLVLIVEDIESNRLLMRKLLEPYYRIAEAINGKMALEYIKENYQQISCILLDLLMPIMDGFQVLEHLHEDEQLSEIPVIIATETGSNSELRALRLGAHSFVAKPYNPDVLLHHVGKAVEERDFIKFKKEYLKKLNNTKS